MKQNRTMKDIGAISTHAKIICGFMSGPMTPCFNEATKNSVKKWIVIDPRDGVRLNEVSYHGFKTIDVPQIEALIRSTLN